jgi:hypothetical protein
MTGLPTRRSAADHASSSSRKSSLDATTEPSRGQEWQEVVNRKKDGGTNADATISPIRDDA